MDSTSGEKKIDVPTEHDDSGLSTREAVTRLGIGALGVAGVGYGLTRGDGAEEAAGAASASGPAGDAAGASASGNAAAVSNAAASQANEFVFQARYPGAFIYHCAIPTLDHHISSGMFGLIVVEPPEGLPEVDREFYVGQHEVYTDTPAGEKGNHRFSVDRMKREDPTYVLLNGEKYGLTGDRRGPMEARVGETARIFFANGGPNLTSSFHPIGSVFSRLWREGAVMSQPERYVQTASVPPGSSLVAELKFPVPGPVKLVDHALSRVARKGMLGVIDVKGQERPEIFDDSSEATSIG